MCGKCDNGLIRIQERHPYGSTYATETWWELCEDLQYGHCANCEEALVSMCGATSFIIGSDECQACFEEVADDYDPGDTYEDCEESNVETPTFCRSCSKDWSEVING